MRTFLVSMILSALLSGGSAVAATVKSFCAANAIQSCFMLIEGQIAIGDLDKVRMAVNQHEGARTAYLHSPGGTLGEALRIGRLLRDSGFSTRVGQVRSEADLFDNPTPESGSCESACAYIFMGGVDRRLRENDVLGLHRFHAPGQKIDGQVAQEMSGDLISYMVEMGIDARLFTLASSQSSEGMLHVSAQQAQDHDLVTSYGFSEIDLEPYKDGLIAWARRKGDLTSLEKVDQVTFLCRDGTPLILFHVAGWGSALANAEQGRFRAILDQTDARDPAVKISKRVSGKDAYLTVAVSPKTGRAISAANRAELFVGYPSVYGGNYGAVLDLSAMDQKKIAVAFRHCIG